MCCYLSPMPAPWRSGQTEPRPGPPGRSPTTVRLQPGGELHPASRRPTAQEVIFVPGLRPLCAGRPPPPSCAATFRRPSCAGRSGADQVRRRRNTAFSRRTRHLRICQRPPGALTRNFNTASPGESLATVFLIFGLAFYTEPSYLGFICLCLYVIRHQAEAIKSNLIAFALLLFLCLVAKTASGFIILCFFFFVVNARGIVLNRRRYPILAILFGVVIYFSLPFISRVLGSTDSASEPSGYIRLVFPMKCVSAVFLHAPLGVPQAELPDFFQANLPADATIGNFDNGLVNVFLYFGIFGFVIWICFIGMMRNWALALFVMLCALYNGNVFAYDKAFLISISILIAMQKTRGQSSMTFRAVAKTGGRPIQYSVEPRLCIAGKQKSTKV